MLDSFKEHEMIKDITDIQGTGHRVVHGGELSLNQLLLLMK